MNIKQAKELINCYLGCKIWKEKSCAELEENGCYLCKHSITDSQLYEALNLLLDNLNRKGKWVRSGYATHRCSACDYVWYADFETGHYVSELLYCPHCGAKMEVESD